MDRTFEPDDRVIVLDDSDGSLIGLLGRVDNVDKSLGTAIVFVELDRYPGNRFTFQPYELDLVQEGDEDYYEPEADGEYLDPEEWLPQFGMDAEDFGNYLAILLARTNRQAARFDANREAAGRGWQAWEATDLETVIEAAMHEVEQTVVGATMLHIRLARVLHATEALGIK